MATQSTLKRYTQTQLTKIFAETLQQPVSQLQYHLWNNPKDTASLRLSLSGYTILKKNGVQSYQFELNDPLTNRHLLQLERYFPGMYFLFKAQKITVYDEQDASMLALMGGDLRGYLENLELNT